MKKHENIVGICERKVVSLLKNKVGVIPSGLSIFRISMNEVSEKCRITGLSLEKYLQNINQDLKEDFSDLGFELNEKQYFTGLLVTQPNKEVVLEFFTTNNKGEQPTLTDISNANC